MSRLLALFLDWEVYTMARRLDFHAILKTITDNVYFQPPSNLEIEFPCIIYERDAASTKFAGNFPYLYKQRYLVTIIDRVPDTDILAKVAALPLSAFNRRWAVDNLNHDAFVIYF
jgi:hypothetical protein